MNNVACPGKSSAEIVASHESSKRLHPNTSFIWPPQVRMTQSGLETLRTSRLELASRRGPLLLVPVPPERKPSWQEQGLCRLLSARASQWLPWWAEALFLLGASRVVRAPRRPRAAAPRPHQCTPLDLEP